MWFKKVALYANRYERHRKVSSSFSEVMILTCCHDAMPVIGVVLRLVVLIKRCNDGQGSPNVSRACRQRGASAAT